MLRDETKMQRPPAQRLVRILRRRRSDWPLRLGQPRKIQIVVGVRGGHAEYESAFASTAVPSSDRESGSTKRTGAGESSTYAMPGGRVADGRVCDCGCSSCDRNECAEQEVERAARSAGEWTREHAGDVGKDFRRADVRAFARSGCSGVDAARAESDRACSRGREGEGGRLASRATGRPAILRGRSALAVNACPLRSLGTETAFTRDFPTASDAQQTCSGAEGGPARSPRSRARTRSCSHQRGRSIGAHEDLEHECGADARQR